MPTFSRFPLLAATLAVGALIPPAYARQDASTYVIEGARIELGNGRVIENGSILIRNGKIAEVGETIRHDKMDVIDGKGLTVYPGFIDGYTSRGLTLPKEPTAGTYPDTRTQAPPTMWPGNRKGLRPDVDAAKCLSLKDQLEDNYSQGVTSALLGPGGATLRGTAAFVNYLEGGADEVVLKSGVGQDVSFRGGSGAAYPGTSIGYIALMRQTFYDAKAYGEKKKAGDKVDKDDVYESLQGLLAGDMPAIFTADSEREIERAYRLADEFGLKLVINSGREAWRNMATLSKRNTAVIASIDIGSNPAQSQFGAGDVPKAVRDERVKRWQDNATNLKKLSVAGIRIAFTNVGAAPEDYLRNVRRVITAGMPRDAALKAMTSGAAQIFGVEDKVGTIEAGKIANLTLMNGDFAKDGTVVRMVIVAGKKIDLTKKTDEGGAN